MFSSFLFRIQIDCPSTREWSGCIGHMGWIFISFLDIFEKYNLNFIQVSQSIFGCKETPFLTKDITPRISHMAVRSINYDWKRCKIITIIYYILFLFYALGSLPRGQGRIIFPLSDTFIACNTMVKILNYIVELNYWSIWNSFFCLSEKKSSCFL